MFVLLHSFRVRDCSKKTKYPLPLWFSRDKPAMSRGKRWEGGGEGGLGLFFVFLFLAMCFLLELAFTQLFWRVGGSIRIEAASGGAQGTMFRHLTVVTEETAHTIDQGSAVGMTKQLGCVWAHGSERARGRHH